MTAKEWVRVVMAFALFFVGVCGLWLGFAAVPKDLHGWLAVAFISAGATAAGVNVTRFLARNGDGGAPKG